MYTNAWPQIVLSEALFFSERLHILIEWLIESVKQLSISFKLILNRCFQFVNSGVKWY